ncbi:hypothetical protein sphantq_04420 (plasmid) [Sphingobium sp. AntQ-1]|nr:transposase [Sphingobium sp. AntQ-1]WCP15930.1 hypothetical protein sphantq_04420 [Sphingobium sp. AntQ-1]
MRQAGLFGLSDQLKRLSDCGDPLETMARVVDFELFRPALEKALAYGNGAKGGRPPYDPVAMFKVLILAAQNTVSDARMEFLIRDRLSWLRFLGFDLGAATPDENTIRLFREKLTRAGAIDTLFAAFDRSLRERGYLPMGGQIVDATLVAAPKQRNTAAERQAIKAGRSAAEIWPDEPARAAQKDTDARWTLKFAKARALPDGRPGIDIAIPSFGYKSSVTDRLRPPARRRYERVRDVHKDVAMDVLSGSEGRLWRYWAESGVAGGALPRGSRLSRRWGCTARHWRALRGGTMSPEARSTSGDISSGSAGYGLRRADRRFCRSTSRRPCDTRSPCPRT